MFDISAAAAIMNPETPVFVPSIFGPSLEEKEIMKNMLKTSTPTSFPQFLQLPPELRLMIWKHALTFPQIHRVAPYHGDSDRFPQNSMVAIKYYSGLRNVCVEAREEATKVQELYSTAKLSGWKKRDGPKPSIFVNPETDTIFMGDMSCRFPKGGKPRPGRIKRLAFLWDHWTSGMFRYDLTPSFLKASVDKSRWCLGLWERGVEEIVLVMDSYSKCFSEPEITRFIEPIGSVYDKEFGVVDCFLRKKFERQLESKLNECQENLANRMKLWQKKKRMGDCPDECTKYCCTWKPIEIKIMEIEK